MITAINHVINNGFGLEMNSKKLFCDRYFCFIRHYISYHLFSSSIPQIDWLPIIGDAFDCFWNLISARSSLTFRRTTFANKKLLF